MEAELYRRGRLRDDTTASPQGGSASAFAGCAPPG
jgi:hypothetical protein